MVTSKKLFRVDTGLIKLIYILYNTTRRCFRKLRAVKNIVSETFLKILETYVSVHSGDKIIQLGIVVNSEVDILYFCNASCLIKKYFYFLQC